MTLILIRKGGHGGIKLPVYPSLPNSPVETPPLPDKVIIPLNGGKATARRGDKVLCGQKISDAEEFSVTPAHATISGEVSGAIKFIDPLSNSPADALVITAGDDNEQVEYQLCQNPESLSQEEIAALVREAGVGGEPPAHIRLSYQKGKIDSVIINACCCQPYLSANTMLMLEYGDECVFRCSDY